MLRCMRRKAPTSGLLTWHTLCRIRCNQQCPQKHPHDAKEFICAERAFSPRCLLRLPLFLVQEWHRQTQRQAHPSVSLLAQRAAMSILAKRQQEYTHLPFLYSIGPDTIMVLPRTEPMAQEDITTAHIIQDPMGLTMVPTIQDTIDHMVHGMAQEDLWIIRIIVVISNRVLS